MYLNKLTFVAVIVVVCSISCTAQQPVHQVNTASFADGIAKGQVQLLDVRTSAEYQSGHLTDALQANWNNATEFEYRIKGLDISKPVYVYCLGGGRSAEAAALLAGRGFTVYNLEGGIQAWKKANQPVEGVKLETPIPLEQFKQLISTDKTVLVDVGAVWCPPCKKMAPLLDSLVGELGEKLQLIKVDGAAQPALSQSLGVEAFPTFIIYKNGKEVWRRQGILSRAELLEQL